MVLSPLLRLCSKESGLVPLLFIFFNTHEFKFKKKLPVYKEGENAGRLVVVVENSYSSVQVVEYL